MTGQTKLTKKRLEAIRQSLPSVHNLCYLNAGTLGPLPQRTIDAISCEHEYDAQIRQAPKHWERLIDLQVRARQMLGKLVGVSSEQMALMHSSHEGLNVCLWGMDLKPGQSIVTTTEEHPGLLVPLRHAVERSKINVRFARWHDHEEKFVEEILALVDNSTRAVMISHVSWTSGRIAPLRALRDALSPSVMLVVDGAQGAGALTVNADRDGWDAYTISGQKWPCGPNGSGGLALIDPERWSPCFGAYMQVVDHTNILNSQLVRTGVRFEQSQESLGPLAGIAESIQWLLDDVGGIDTIEQHARVLNQQARSTLMKSGLNTSNVHGSAHLLCIETEDPSAEQVSERMLEDGFLIRPLGSSRVRLSFGCWNTPDEIVRACSALTNHLSLP